MRAAQVNRPGGPAELAVQDAPEPTPRAGEVLIDVEAAGVGYLDVVCTHGRHQLTPSFPFTPGFEVSGVLRSAPPVGGLAAGQRVAAFVHSGGLAEVVAAEAELVIPLPDGVDQISGCAAIVNTLTALYALKHRAKVRPGEWVVVHGGAGGLGLAAIQVARDAGANAIAVVSDKDRGELALTAGARDFLVLGESWVDDLKRRLVEHGAGSVDLVLDPVGGERIEQSLPLLRDEGRVVSLGFVAGIPRLAVNRLLVRNIDLLAVDWDPRAPITRRLLIPQLTELLAAGRVRGLVTRVEPLEHAREVLVALEDRTLAGKAVLTV